MTITPRTPYPRKLLAWLAAIAASWALTGSIVYGAYQIIGR